MTHSVDTTVVEFILRSAACQSHLYVANRRYPPTATAGARNWPSLGVWM